VPYEQINPEKKGKRNRLLNRACGGVVRICSYSNQNINKYKQNKAFGFVDKMSKSLRTGELCDMIIKLLADLCDQSRGIDLIHKKSFVVKRLVSS
jgi:hypothetical protein